MTVVPDPNEQERLTTEYATLCLDHPNGPQVYGASTDLAETKRQAAMLGPDCPHGRHGIFKRTISEWEPLS